jgi:hypothetical protein
MARANIGRPLAFEELSCTRQTDASLSHQTTRIVFLGLKMDAALTFTVDTADRFTIDDNPPAV